jgi:bifunctional non-homologous end joining protein LigD
VLAGWTIHLRASPGVIGFLGALPLCAQLVTLPAAWFIGGHGRKRVTVAAVAVSRPVFRPLVALPALDVVPATKLRRASLIVATSTVFGAIGDAAWVAWAPLIGPPAPPCRDPHGCAILDGMTRSRATASRRAAARPPRARRGPPPPRRPAAAPDREPPAALAEYRRKRDFRHTPEPAGEALAPRRAGERIFVIQKHAATRLHYDFRLELEGVLKSWAVPKGPSLDPLDKRLAMHVEDHPLEYATFEGVIPKGEYGGGPVLLWDRGTWEPEGDPHQGYRAGNLKFALHGEKLRGSWALVRMRGRRAGDDDRTWLLIKHRDAAARPAASGGIVDDRPESVATGRTLAQIAAAADRVWHSGPARAARDGRPRPSSGSPPARPDPAEVPGARPGVLPRFLAPQPATLVTRAPDGDEWLHELKFDGYRILGRLAEGRAVLLSRNGRDWTQQFPGVARGVAALPAREALLDGEVAALLPDGTTSFQALQNFMADGGQGQLVYMVFDLLHLDGFDLTRARLEDRKAALKRLLDAAGAGAQPLRFSDHVVGAGPAVFSEACRLGLEGVISKRRDAPYRGARGPDWLKLKCLREQEAVIGGYTDPEGTRIGLGALLLGVQEGGRLVYIGKVGTGFTGKTLEDLKRRLDRLAQASCPFTPPPRGVKRPHWVKPELVAQVRFSEWTTGGKLRQPSFQGLREDKPAAEVVRERPSAAAAAARRGRAPRARARGGRDGPEPEDPGARHPGAAETVPAPRRGQVDSGGPGATAEVAGVRLTHPGRVLYPPQGTTKLDLARYYEAIAEWILPHLRDRPTTLVRCPDGAHTTCFYQKHAGHWAPETVRRVEIRERAKVGEYLVVDDLPALIGLVQIGILEIHTWNAVVARLERPDRVVFDLDPGPRVEWPRVVDAARRLRARLQALGLESFVKTSGGKGLHLLVPLAAGTTWDEGLDFARRVAAELAREDPQTFVAHMAKAARGGRIFVDYLRNARGATTVAAYSTRARPEAPVSVPLDWDELSPTLRPDHHTIATVPRRLARLRVDPWRRYASVRQALPPPPAG